MKFCKFTLRIVHVLNLSGTTFFLEKRHSINIFAFLQNLSFLNKEYPQPGLVTDDRKVKTPWNLGTLNCPGEIWRLFSQSDLLTYIQRWRNRGHLFFSETVDVPLWIANPVAYAGISIIHHVTTWGIGAWGTITTKMTYE